MTTTADATPPGVPDRYAAAPMVATSVRLPAPIHIALTRQAAGNVRSFNQELVAILRGVSPLPRTDG